MNFDQGHWVCDCCGSTDDTVEHHHQNTAYVKDELNWVTLCGPCRKENDEYWEAMWAEYYAGRL